MTLQCVNNHVSQSKVYEWVEKLERCTMGQGIRKEARSCKMV